MIQKKMLLSLIAGAMLLLGSCGKQQAKGNIKADTVIVFKAKRTMQLRRKGKIIATYAISLGENPEGHKQQEGDERTPEGVYTLDWRNAKSSCYKSLHISYPNDADVAQARQLGASPGGMVMIHGLHPSITWLGRWHTLYDWTNGCVGVTNAEMDEIWQTVPDGTPIEIKP